MRRKLEGFEHSLTFSSECAPFHLVCVLKIEGRLDGERLRQVFAALQKKHPLLRTRIESERGAYYFVFGNAVPIEVTLAERKTPQDWVVAVEDELNRRMDYASGPLVRCLFLQNSREPGGSAEILLTLHHSIIDARSVLPLIREILAGCAGAEIDLGAEVAGEGAAAGITLFPREFQGVGFVRAVIFYMMRQMADEAAYRWAARGSRKPPIDMSARNKILPVRFPAPITAALIQSTRRERVTLNSILTAAQMLAVKRQLYPSRDTPLRNITFTDLRPYLGTTVPEGVLGCHMGMCRFTVQMKDNADFWRLAHEVNGTIYRANRRGERFLGNALSPGMMKMIFRMKKIRMGATALSYAGPIAMDHEMGPIRVLGVHAFISNMGIGPECSALVRLYRDELWWDMLYLDSDMGPEKAQRIVDEIRSILDQAVSAR
jgi:NRPS condensation-like uncharacterized protein